MYRIVERGPNCTILACFLTSFLLPFSSRADVRVFIQDSNGLAGVYYQCTQGEVVRAFALDISVDRGVITAIQEFFRGISQANATGYGIFPAAFRDHAAGNAVTNFDWQASDYSPLANPGDSPGDTMPGLNSSGVTLEFGGLWDPNSAGIPGPAGRLCVLSLSTPAQVSVRANLSRGGIVGAGSLSQVNSVFTGSVVGPDIIDVNVENGVLTITFGGGELQTSTSLGAPWNDTGNSTGIYREALGADDKKFFRVRSH